MGKWGNREIGKERGQRDEKRTGGTKKKNYKL